MNLHLQWGKFLSELWLWNGLKCIIWKRCSSNQNIKTSCCLTLNRFKQWNFEAANEPSSALKFLKRLNWSGFGLEESGEMTDLLLGANCRIQRFLQMNGLFVLLRLVTAELFTERWKKHEAQMMEEMRLMHESCFILTRKNLWGYLGKFSMRKKCVDDFCLVEGDTDFITNDQTLFISASEKSENGPKKHLKLISDKHFKVEFNYFPPGF